MAGAGILRLDGKTPPTHRKTLSRRVLQPGAVDGDLPMIP